MASSDCWKILFIDDEADIREVVTLALEDAGYQVVTAADGRGGVRMCRDARPQIVITDIRMPKMDGIQVLEAVKRMDPDIEVIVITAFGEMDLAVRALQLDASDFITKPINDPSLHIALRRAKERYTARRELKDYTALLEKEKADQARIQHQDKMMSLGRLASSVVHEINNPLSGVLNYIRLMARVLRRGPLSEDHREKFLGYLDLIESETDRCAHIVSSLLAFSRKSAPDFGPVDVAELLERCIAISRHKITLQNIRIETRVAPDLPPVYGDFNSLQQCVINLLFNAVDAMPDGGDLILDGGFDAADNTVRIAVGDTGHGIAPEDLPHIFEPFFTTKKEGYGVGLGLSTLYGILERHKGAIDVKSRPGQGTTFTIQLPAAPSSG